MARYAYQRLDPQSAALLQRESSRHFAHSGATLIFEAGPLARPDGGVDFEAIRAAIESRLHRAPGYRRKLRWIPVEKHPVWVDDFEFNLDYHVRHTSLPRPGSGEQLRRVAARLQSQRLDRSRPLWEYWVLEGLEDGRFALLTKTHNALVAGSGTDLLPLLLSADPDAEYAEPPPFRPQPLPSTFELAYDELLRQARLPRQVLERLRAVWADAEDPGRLLRSRLQAAARLLGYSLREAAETPLNGAVGPHRRFDHLVMPLPAVRAVRRRLGGTLLDVVLTTLAGAVGRYLADHFVNAATLDFRVAVPVAKGTPGDEGVGEWVVELPIWESDPVRRFQRIHASTQALRRESDPISAGSFANSEVWPDSKLPAAGARAMAHTTPVHLRVACVAGPQRPLFLRGARLLECYGKVPLTPNGGLGVAVFGYDGRLCWGLNADFDLVADLPRFTRALAESFRELERAAGPLALVRAS